MRPPCYFYCTNNSIRCFLSKEYTFRVEILALYKNQLIRQVVLFNLPVDAANTGEEKFGKRASCRGKYHVSDIPS